MSTILLDIVTPERTVFSQEVEMVIATGISGEIGILPGHTPILVALRPHVMRLKIDGSERYVAVSGGYLEVSKEKITVLARTAELPEEIDLERAEAAKARAEELLRMQDEKIDHARARAALERAMSRIKIVKK